jgi:hypothetical protein
MQSFLSADSTRRISAIKVKFRNPTNTFRFADAIYHTKTAISKTGNTDSEA